MNFIKNNVYWITFMITAWFIISVLFSFIQIDRKACNKTYPINYIFYSRLFCEIKNEKQI